MPYEEIFWGGVLIFSMVILFLCVRYLSRL